MLSLFPSHPVAATSPRGCGNENVTAVTVTWRKGAVTDVVKSVRGLGVSDKGADAGRPAPSTCAWTGTRLAGRGGWRDEKPQRAFAGLRTSAHVSRGWPSQQGHSDVTFTASVYYKRQLRSE